MSYGEAATQTVKGLSASPVILLIAVLNIVMLGSMLYVAKNARDERRELREQEEKITKVVTDMCAKHP